MSQKATTPSEESSAAFEPFDDWDKRWMSTPCSLASALGLLILAGALFFGQLTDIGIWTPWEAQVVRTVASDSTPSEKEASGSGRTDDASKTTSKVGGVRRAVVGATVGSDDLTRPAPGALELRVRIGIAVIALLFILTCFAWIRRYYGTWRALITCVIIATTPLFYTGSLNAASLLLDTSLFGFGLMAFSEMLLSDRRSSRYLYGSATGVLLFTLFLQHRFFGLFLGLAVFVGMTLVSPSRSLEQPESETGRSRFGWQHILASILLIGTAAWAVYAFVPGNGTDGLVASSLGSWYPVAMAGSLLLVAALIGASTPVGRRLYSGPGITALGVAAGAIVGWGVIAGAGDRLGAFVTGPFGGEIPGDAEVHFGMWLRQMAYGAFPWSVFFPIAVGYLTSRAAGGFESGMPDPRKWIETLCLIAGLFALPIAVFSHFAGHSLGFVGTVPLSIGVGLSLTDRDFWRRVKQKTYLASIAGFTAISGMMIIAKDFERFPDRLLEAFVPLFSAANLPEDFAYGPVLDALKYGWVLLIGVFFFGLITWGLTGMSRVKRWANNRFFDGEDRKLSRRPTEAQKRDWRASYPILRGLETLPGWSLLLAAAGVATAGVIQFGLIPRFDDHFSRRGVYEEYVSRRDDGETLYRYKVDLGNHPIYLGQTSTIDSDTELIDQLGASERVFVVIPREELPDLNFRMRRRYDRNLPVLYAKSNRVLLISNRLEGDEANVNPLEDAIIANPEEANPQHSLHYSGDGQMKRASFDGRVSLLGYSLDKESKNGHYPVYKWGEYATIETYFRVDKRLDRDYEIFMHVDTGGNRIHGDHKPVDGQFPTRFWLPGDVVVDRYRLFIPPYSSPGVYKIYMGLYKGDDRLPVDPDSAHDGGDRVLLGQFVVEPDYL